MKQSEILATLKELSSELNRYAAGSDSIVPGAYVEALDAAIETLDRIRWRKVEGELPELKEKAICLNKHGDMMIGTYTEWGWILPCFPEANPLDAAARVAGSRTQMKETRMKIVVDKMPEKMEDCPRHYIEQNAVGDKWDACSMGFICCDGVEKCPFYIGFDELMKGRKDG